MNFEEEFPQIMKRGGFDAIVGNPPYIRIHNLVDHQPQAVKYIQRTYDSAQFGKIDIYIVFIEKGLSLLNKKGLLGFIVPNKFMQADYGRNLRNLIASQKALYKIIDFSHGQVFKNATTYTCLLFLSGTSSDHFIGSFNTRDQLPQAFLNSGKYEELPISDLPQSAWSLALSEETRIIKKLEVCGKPLPQLAELAITGVKTGANHVFTLEPVCLTQSLYVVRPEGREEAIELEAALLRPYWKAESMKRYQQYPASRLLLYPYYITNGKTTLIPETELEASYPRIWDYLNSHRSTLEKRQKSKLKGPYWYGLSFSSALQMFLASKIVTPTLAPINSFSIDEGAHLFPQGAGGGCGIVLKKGQSQHYFLGLLNSRLLTFYFQRISSRFQGGWFAYEPRYLNRIPIRTIDFTNKDDKARHDKIVLLVKHMLDAKKQLTEAATDRDRSLYERKCANLDHQIDSLVYELYELTPDEIAIVEES